MTNEVKQSIITRFREIDGKNGVVHWTNSYARGLIEAFILEIAEESEKRGISLVTESSYVCPRHTTTLRCLDCIGENIKVIEDEA